MPLADLKHLPVEDFQRKKCSLCNFLTHMLQARDAVWDANYYHHNDRYNLYVGSAKEEYGIPEFRSDISDSFCVWIGSERCRPSYMYDSSLPYDQDSVGDLYIGLALEVSNDPGKIGGRLVGPYADFELIKSWFDDCTLHHGTTTCQTDTSNLQNIPGLRVIDCSSRRLVSWSQLPTNQDRNYVALSYVWGTKPDDGNKELNQTANWRLPSKLPPLIEDTITSVIKLGFRYLWLDRYCIPQGDQEAKHTQVQNMDSIYGSASLTIIAAAGNDPSHGLPGVSLPRYGRGRPDKNLPVSVRIGSRTFVTVGTGDILRKLRESKWNTRAWTMQEAFLSCRCLVFFDDGAYFQCSSPRSHRFEAIHEPSALLQLRHEVLSTKQQNDTKMLADSLILTKVGKAGDLQLRWCLQLVKDYFLRSMTFEDDTLNAFSGILKYLHSLPRPVSNLWGVLMLPEVISTSSGRRIRYNLVRSLAWFYYNRDDDSILYKLEKLEGTTVPPRKEMFPSWTWADWRPRVELHGGGGDDRKYDISYHLGLLGQDSSFTSLVDLSVELDDGRTVSWPKGYLYDSDVSWLAALPNPPRILHIQGYTANPQLRYMTKTDWSIFNMQSILTIKDTHAHRCSEYGGYSQDHWNCNDDTHRWILIDADGQHLQPILEPAYREEPWCCMWQSDSYCRQLKKLSADAYQFQRQRGNQADTIKPYTECTFDFRAIVLGYDHLGYVYYMMLMKADSQTETFERVNVTGHNTGRLRWRLKNSADVNIEEFLAKGTGEHAEPFRGTPWVKMNTRIA